MKTSLQDLGQLEGIRCRPDVLAWLFSFAVRQRAHYWVKVPQWLLQVQH